MGGLNKSKYNDTCPTYGESEKERKAYLRGIVGLSLAYYLLCFISGVGRSLIAYVIFTILTVFVMVSLLKRYYELKSKRV